jgi:hypothetical protein
MKDEIKYDGNMRGVQDATIVQVYEGKGTMEDPGRIVSYVYTDHYVGKIDPNKND